MREKKVRGIKQKMENMVKRIKGNTAVFPTDFYNGYWHMHLPVHQGFISSDQTPRKVKQLCIQTLIDRAGYLKDLKPYGHEEYRVVASIDFPSLWNSQIIVFKGNEHFQDFFIREDEDQKWIPLPETRNIQAEWNLDVPANLSIFGFKEIIDDEDGYYESEIWFIGDHR